MVVRFGDELLLDFLRRYVPDLPDQLMGYLIGDFFLLPERSRILQIPLQRTLLLIRFPQAGTVVPEVILRVQVRLPVVDEEFPEMDVRSVILDRSEMSLLLLQTL